MYIMIVNLDKYIFLYHKTTMISIDSHPASSSSAHFSSSNEIKLGAGTDTGAGADTCLALDPADEFVFPVFLEDVVRDEALDGFEIGSSFNQDSKLTSRCGFEISVLD
ncbi:unnamed protein product [Rotaria magnacalcarata]|uniref:Uncharacterized protein n=1 Tax=Rotaria magnacalcarata TaxID=392030 RepID=A0A8S2VQR7_9BILA|nr:unnamed protein product [Rotaria magnacalcarata]CAF4411801.1 unnamed protein product [Rotaria magnacalcarata]